MSPNGLGAVTHPQETPRTPSRIGYAVGIVFLLVMLQILHADEVWRPWLGGIVTERWDEVLWVIDLSLWTQIVGNALLLVARPRRLRRLVSLANAVMAAVSAVVFFQVYPYDFSILFEGLDVVVKVLIAIGIAGSVIAALVHLVRFVTGW